MPLLQIYVLIFGEVVNGAKRWISLGSLGKFQPSELTKIAVILFTAYIVNMAPRKLDKFTGFGVLLYIALARSYRGGELLIALIICIIMVAICFIASKKRHIS